MLRRVDTLRWVIPAFQAWDPLEDTGLAGIWFDSACLPFLAPEFGRQAHYDEILVAPLIAMTL